MERHATAFNFSSSRNHQFMVINDAQPHDQVDVMEFTIPLLQDSILLRYLPVPFVKYLYEATPEKFLHIYREHDYHHPILIWNSKMRKTLEQKIKDKARDFVYELRSFSEDD